MLPCVTTAFLGGGGRLRGVFFHRNLMFPGAHFFFTEGKHGTRDKQDTVP